MGKFNKFLEEKVMPIAEKIAGQRHLLALRDGIIATMPLIIVGSLFLILANLPIPHYADWMTAHFGSSWSQKLSYPVDATFNIMALVSAFTVAYRLAETYNIDAMGAGVVSVAGFLTATPFSFLFTPEGANELLVTGAISKAFLGSKGLFVALIIGILSTEIYRWFVKRDIVIKMPAGVPPTVGKSFVALIPAFAVVITVWVIRLLVELTPYESINNLITTVLSEPLSLVGATLGGTLVTEGLTTLLWSCGLHGTNIVQSVMDPVWYGLMDENRLAFQAHQALPNVITKQFFDNFVRIGGTGATFGLVLSMMLFARSKQTKQLGKLAIGPAIFNINEPVIFGLPIVLNPIMIIPFIGTSLVTITVTYIAMSTGLVAKPAGIAVPWTMPPVISGYLAAGGKISGAVMQIIDIGISFLIYTPFFKIWDKQKSKEEQGLEQSSVEASQQASI